jgi:hypothetical protein
LARSGRVAMHAARVVMGSILVRAPEPGLCVWTAP